MLQRQSLMLHISLSILLITSVMLAIFLFYRYTLEAQTINKDLEYSLEQITTRLSVSLSTPYFNYYNPSITSIIRSEMNDPNIFSIETYDFGNNSPSFAFGRTNDKIVSNFAGPPPDDKFTLSKPILYGGENLGSIKVTMSKILLEKKLKKLFTEILILVLIVGICLNTFIILILRLVVVRPIKQLTDASINITNGNLEYPIKVQSSGEIALLTISFKEMTHSLKAKINELQLEINERRRTEKSLRDSEEKLARAKKMEALGLLAGGVAHDLNNILSGIVSYPELILMDLPEDSKFRNYIETMQASGLRAADIVQDLLTVARGVATTKEPLNLNDLVDDYLHSPEFNELKHFHPTVTVKTNLDSNLFTIAGSYVHIRKVVMNLVSNASEAIEGSGNVTISTVNRYVDRPLRGYDDVNIGEYAILSLSDNGSGIISGDLERIFEPFYTKKILGRSGSGLGLAVVWNVVQDHEGYIDVTSGKDGTTFELYFPITRHEISDKILSIPIKDYKGNGEAILVVDDMESQQKISCKMLDKLGYKTKAVSSGEEAVEYLKENTADLILLDMIMDTGMNGRETYERIIEIHPNQKAVIVSGFAETDEVKKAQKLGAGRYIKKPLTLETIGLAVKEELKK